MRFPFQLIGIVLFLHGVVCIDWDVGEAIDEYAGSTHNLKSSLMQATNDDEERLTIDMFRGYNNLIRPFPCNNSTITFVEFGIALVLLIGIDEKNQIMHTSIWETLQWTDCGFGWNPNDYHGLESIREEFSADGNYEVSFKSNVVVDYKGKVTWFDEQTCHLVFGSWTYDNKKVQLRWYNNKKAVELEDYQVFFLPAECSEKITLGISLLLALVVFLLLVSKILPPTSDTVPLIAKYLLLVFLLNVITILVTVIIVNVYYRSAVTHRMPRIVRQIFLKFLPRLLLMQRPERIPIFNGCSVEEYSVDEIFDATTILPFAEIGRRNQPQYPSRHHRNCAKLKQSTKSRRWSLARRSTDSAAPRGSDFGLPADETVAPNRYRVTTDTLLSGRYTFGPTELSGETRSERAEHGHEQRVSRELKTTVESIAFIADHLKNSISEKKIKDDWRFISMIIDRLLLLVFFGITAGGTISIIFSAPHVFEYIDQMRWDPRRYDGIGTGTLCFGSAVSFHSLNLNTHALEMFAFLSTKLILFCLFKKDETRPLIDSSTTTRQGLVACADGNYEVSFYSNVVVESNGDMLWVNYRFACTKSRAIQVPPAIYKSSCTISVDYFPVSTLVESSQEVVINYLSGKRQVELNDYSESGIWDLIEAPGQLIQKKSKIAYRIRMRSILLALVVFLLLVSKILPPVSEPDLIVHYCNSDLIEYSTTCQISVDNVLLKHRYNFGHRKNSELYQIIKEEWKYISMVIDRLLLYVFFGITLGGTLGILLSAPNVFETTNQTQIIQELMKSAAAEVASHVIASDDEEKLLVDKFRGYNSLIQPVKHINDTPIIVKIALQLVLLINVDEKDQIMHMTWNPTHYGGLKEIRVSPDKVWLPDIVLADGNYEVSFMCNVVIGHKGDMLWFDEQTCHLIFGSWTYNENEIKLEFEQADVMDLSEYAPSKFTIQYQNASILGAIWDVIGAPAALVKKRSRVEFQLRIRRKTLFYTVLIIPTVLMAFLSMAVFFLPTDSGEKMTLTISVLLSIVVFLLLVSKILPPTSSTIPLMAKYLLLTMVLNVITILVTVIIINVYFRGPTTHRMPRWVKILFLKLMPRLLCMRRPKPMMQKMLQKNPQIKNGLMNLAGLGNFTNSHHPHCPSADLPSQPKGDGPTQGLSSLYPLTPDAMRAMDSVEYITEHLKKGEERKLIKEEWKYVSMVIDRLLLLVFFGITAGGTIGKRRNGLCYESAL
ncbi:Acetylcholine receptor subunit beta-type unc-29 [Aphelenchoides besseyi]|nr:Acetylcholine receptor subunit beta-type unc-29 [Aphelenchoides besseyi]